MNPIINPIWFYLMSIADKTVFVFTLIAISSFTISIVYYLFALDNIDEQEMYDHIQRARQRAKMYKYNLEEAAIEGYNKAIKEKNKSVLKTVKTGFCLSIVFTILAILTPNKTTCKEMMIASIVTSNNLEAVQDSIVDLVEDIMEAANIEEKETN